MGGVTKLRVQQTRADEKYDPIGDSIASDKEVEARVKKHSSMFHDSREEYKEFVYTSKLLTELNTYYDVGKTIKAETNDYVYSGNKTLISTERKIYDDDGVTLYSHIIKTFNYDGQGDLIGIVTTKII
jgi:hypothetical protein